ncbi:hypothetical protein [Hydrogenophaga sp. BPS33]|uniref:hypothetical protein n=1 Tax=Hydrogenophaga sp. BPS33 TaxID=2651974 RepID=UPI0013203A5A|nr:hypothetical protein [Hydrogenophaga sp. BPS33]QHE86892.1 hypothetical protein F9K07_19295 [Hydrogenophaga sp. BPS33]
MATSNLTVSAGSACDRRAQLGALLHTLNTDMQRRIGALAHITAALQTEAQARPDGGGAC